MTRRAWWKRKRWWAAAAVWLALPILYVLSAAPASYAMGCGWMSEDAVATIYRPAARAMERTPLDDPWVRFNTWCRVRGAIHEERRLQRQRERPIFLD